jgi:hypothetical protein
MSAFSGFIAVAVPAIQFADSAIDRVRGKIQKIKTRPRAEPVAVLARRQSGQHPECPDESAGIAVTDLFGDAVDRRIAALQKPLRGFDPDPAKILPRRQAGGV